MSIPALHTVFQSIIVNDIKDQCDSEDEIQSIHCRNRYKRRRDGRKEEEHPEHAGHNEMRQTLLLKEAYLRFVVACNLSPIQFPITFEKSYDIRFVISQVSVHLPMSPFFVPNP